MKVSANQPLKKNDIRMHRKRPTFFKCHLNISQTSLYLYTVREGNRKEIRFV